MRPFCGSPTAIVDHAPFHSVLYVYDDFFMQIVNNALTVAI